MATSEPVRARIVELTRSMSGATSSARRLSEAWCGYSKGRTTAKIHLRTLRKQEHRNGMLPGQVRKIAVSPHSDTPAVGEGLPVIRLITAVFVRNSSRRRQA